MIIDFQINQGSGPWSLIEESVRAAEEAGFDTLWNLDHFSGEMFQSDTMPECFTTLTAWAHLVSTIKLGTLVTNINNRHPGLLANIVSTLQEVSGGRLTLGIGAGASPTSPWGAEQRALGIDMLPTMRARHEKLLKSVQVMRRVWANDRHEDFQGFPRPKIAPRIIAGTNSVALARIAGEHLDGVNTRWNHPERREILQAAREASGNREDLDVSVWAPFVPEYGDPENNLHQELAAEGVTRLVLFEDGKPDPKKIAAMSRYLG
jgi:alkanesulfonate monooxygenase SsuD/methylene tetrahydromethanopterin reductase-like flavin-dependent oxidoreductase (luciferase family)